MSDDDLVTWLTGVLDEVARTARLAEQDAASPWFVKGREGLVRHSGPEDYCKDDGLWDSESCTEEWQPLCMKGPVARHVAMHDPAAALADVAAKRAILELHDPREDACPPLPNDDPDAYEASFYDPWCPTVRLLAALYADWSGYRPEWRPAT